VNPFAPVLFELQRQTAIRWQSGHRMIFRETRTLQNRMLRPSPVGQTDSVPPRTDASGRAPSHPLTGSEPGHSELPSEKHKFVCHQFGCLLTVGPDAMSRIFVDPQEHRKF
jgi:hypothetical protein